MTADNPILLIGTGMSHDHSDLASDPDIVTADAVIGSSAVLDSLNTITARKIPVKTPVSETLDTAEILWKQGKRIAVLTSGDPLFYSLGVSFVQRFGEDAFLIRPGFTSMQTAATRLCIPWDSVITVSVHGRKGFLPLAHAAMRQSSICLLTDRANTPARAAQFLLKRGLTQFSVRIAARLGNDDELFWRGSLAEATEGSFPTPCVAFFLPDTSLPAPLPLCPGQPEAMYVHEGALITKWPVRAAVLAALRIEPHHIVWDLGAGSGSVAVEAASLAREGHVIAVERESGRISHIEENRKKFGAANLAILHATMPLCLETTYAVASDAELPDNRLPDPNRIFIGGGLGGSPEEATATIHHAWQRLLPGGRMVIACVLLENFALARKELLALTPNADVTLVQTAVSYPLGNDIHLQGQNPVFLIATQKN